MIDPAGRMRAAATHLRDRTDVDLLWRVADLLDFHALEADETGPNHHAERVAAAILGLADPWPTAKPPARPAPEPCWRCGQDCAGSRVVLRVRGHDHPVHDHGCSPTLVRT